MARHLDLRLLAQFQVVCETAKMATAARRLGLSAPAVSQIVQKLERDLGVVLFERSSQGLRLTPAGSILQERASEILGCEEDILREMDAYRAQLLPKLRIYIAESVARYAMPAIVSELHPVVGHLEVKSGRSTSYVQEFLKGEYDVLISSEGLGDVPGLDRYKICTERLIGLCPAAVPPDRRRLPELVDDLPFIGPGFNSRMHQLIEGYLANQRLDLPRSIECSSVAPILEMVGSGIGWTLSTPLSVAYYQPDPSRIATFELPQPVPARSIFVVVHGGKLLDVPQVIATRSNAAIRRHAGMWPPRLAEALTIPLDVTDG
ncbi:LysR family transcriptional regulator [Mangrovibrevibacter kandeliae]|uniref:LysR family transcriptional regulator n=1 Tax=Mangrovibrevibacter kandeliae TaxID=2968473 RepID=UPI002118E793|nr:LysR family transcriptional regulator [Aurantimonas sp. CSK15Z-1]MCQ8781854.1 LysR family transcriptional regulator [Aurantimonas sp. CSK15Z-1]